MSRPPLVSVLMPVWNAGPFLAPAVESVLGQTLGDLELLAVDDGSTDGSGERLREFAAADRRVRPIFHARNLGIAPARNALLPRARGRFVAFLNHDDLARPTRLAEQVAYFDAHPDLGLLGTAVEYIDPAGKSLNRLPMPETALEIRWMGLLDCPVRQSAAMLRAEVFSRHGLRYDPAFISHSDYEFLVRATRAVPSANLPAVLTAYRKHPRNSTRLRWDLFVENGARIAEREIHLELPEFPIASLEIAEIRSVLLSYTPHGVGRPLATVRRAVARYLDLFDAFVARHRGDPALGALRERATTAADLGVASPTPLAA